MKTEDGWTFWFGFTPKEWLIRPWLCVLVLIVQTVGRSACSMSIWFRSKPMLDWSEKVLNWTIDRRIASLKATHFAHWEDAP